MQTIIWTRFLFLPFTGELIRVEFANKLVTLTYYIVDVDDEKLMADIHDATGVITKTSSHSCEVSFTVGDTSHSISFNKSVLHTFGVQCEGNMTNILDNDMEVELCYRIFSPGRKPCIVAVWLGEKPDNPTIRQSSLTAVYDSKGHVVNSTDNEFLVEDQDNNIVYINKKVVFQDGSPLKDNMTIDQEIIFDAIPFKYEHPSGAAYQATCAWIGLKPRLVDRFDLHSSKLDLILSGKDIVQGTVAVIPNDVVALVDVVLESKWIKVFLFRNSFKDRCDSIGEVIATGDVLSMILAYKSIFPGRKLWYASQAAKSRDDLCWYQEVSPVSLIEINPPCNVADEQLAKFSKGTEILYNIPPLSGVISLLPDGYAACITYGDIKVFVPSYNFYIAGNRCSHGEFVFYVGPGTNIALFEAILLPDAHKKKFTHEATCAWVGRIQKPAVPVLAASLCRPNPFLLKKGKCFVGFVAKFLSPFMAFVLIPDENTFVLINVNSFFKYCQPRYLPVDKTRVYITNYVKLNDMVQLDLQVNPLFPTLFLTYNIRFLSPVEISGATILDLEAVDLDLHEKISPDKKSLPGQKIISKKNKTAVVDTVKKTSVKSLPPPPPSTLRKNCHSKNRRFLLNCSGNIIVEEGVDVKVKHVFGTSSVNLTTVGFLPTSVLLYPGDILEYNGGAVRFDAEFIISESSHHVLKLWNEGEERPDSECLLASSLARWEQLFVNLSGCSETRDVFYTEACIHSIPLHDSAIATVEKTGLSILVPLKSLISSEEINANTSSIERFLSIGDKIFAKVRKHDYNDVAYFRTVACFAGTNFPAEVNSNAEFESLSPRRITWMSVWGRCEWYRKGPIVFKNGCLSRKIKRSASLDLCEKGNVVVPGQLVSPEHVGEDVNLAEDCPDEDLGERYFVTWDWIADVPPLKLVLKDALAVPKGLVSCMCWYEVVVADFPVPTHALCYIGHVPILLRLIVNDTITEEGPALKFRVGDRLVVQVEEDRVEKGSVVILSDSANAVEASEYPVKDVFRNLTGTVVTLPGPTGMIRVVDADFEVAFELCHVQSLQKCGRLSLKEWRDFVCKVSVGRRVCFSAIKIEAENVLYRAFEVFLID